MNKSLELVKSELEKYGLIHHVSISWRYMENESGYEVAHIVAKWKETNVDVDGYKLEETYKVEELNKYFSAEVFALGITQRAKWIQADHSDRVAYLEENPFGHPALYPVWAESRKAA